MYLFFLSLAAVMMYFLYRKVSWKEDILPGLQTANWWLVLLSFAFGYLATIIRGLRWNVMLEPMGYHANNWTNIHSVAFGYCMNNLVPRSGELARCTLLNRAEKIPVDKLIGTVILERIVDVIMLALILFLAFILNADALNNLLTSGNDPNAPESEKSAMVWYILGAGLLGLFFAIWILRKFRHVPFIVKVNSFLTGISIGLRSVVKLQRKLLFLVYSVGIWTCWVLMTFCIMKALVATQAMDFSDTIFFIGAGSLGMIVPTPGGAGAFHGMSELAFVALGYERKAGKVFALISWSGKTTFDILVGAFGFFIVTSRKIIIK